MEARLIILRSPDGESDWTPVMPDQVPEWLKDPVVVGRLVNGEMAQGPSGILLPDQFHPWYRAERAPTIQ
jgi:hypothetical protein